MSKEQRIIFTISKTLDGKQKINMTFYPKLAKDKETFDKLNVYMKEMQTTAAHIGRFVMQALANQQKETPELSVQGLPNGGGDPAKATLPQQSQAGQE